MLTKSFKDQQQRKIDQALNAGLQLAFVPESWDLKAKQQIDEILIQTAGISLTHLTARPTDEIIAILKKQAFSFSNLEHFADLLIHIAGADKDSSPDLIKKAVAIYEFAQQENQLFSLGLLQKINHAQTLL